ncbi:MAG: cytidylate kinase [Bacteroides sp. SM23_62_1]|nr:MAG: cytidylate kinase [Bacteroides sp. SM23_62_1]
MPENIVIAVDGPSSSGKSTFAKAIASELGITYIDSGAMYRAVTLFCLRNGLIIDGIIDIPSLIHRLNQIKIEFRFNDTLNRLETYLNGENVEDEIRNVAVSKFVSPVSKVEPVREKMVDLQRSMAKDRSVVMDGRDIGTVVFPEADIKLFLIANEEVRARRRYDELRQKGINISFQDVLNNISDRDYQDSNRSISPLAQAKDAIALDNSNMGVDGQMEWFRKLLDSKYGKKQKNESQD